MNKQPSQRLQELADITYKALVLAGEEARKISKQTGTPLIVVEKKEQINLVKQKITAKE